MFSSLSCHTRGATVIHGAHAAWFSKLGDRVGSNYFFPFVFWVMTRCQKGIERPLALILEKQNQKFQNIKAFKDKR